MRCGHGQFDLVIRNGTVLDGSGGEPREADVAIKDGRIAAVGRVDGAGREEIDAKGQLVTPGFVDIHTHYDGQVDLGRPASRPSSGHGVTTVVMGNCGVGFAPCRPQDRETLIKLMEGVEDIPEIVMTEGVPWNWESFPEYLDALDAAALRHRLRRPGAARAAARLRDGRARRRPRAGDRAGHGARWRALVRGGDRGRRARLLDLALAVPSHDRRRADADHHRRRGGADGDRPRHAARRQGRDPAGRRFRRRDRARGRPSSPCCGGWSRRRAGRCRSPCSTSRSIPAAGGPCCARSSAPTATACRSSGQVAGRPVALLYGLELSFNPFSTCPSYAAVADLPLEQKLAKLRDPALRAKLLAEDADLSQSADAGLHAQRRATCTCWAIRRTTRRRADSRLDARGARSSASRRSKLAYDLLVSGDGRTILFHPGANYTDCLRRQHGEHAAPRTR